MKWKFLLQIFSVALVIALFSQCKGPMGNHDVFNEVDDDSDRPEWAGGKTDQNPHIKKNDQSGTTRGGDYGDLFVLKRDINGVPVMREMPEYDEEGEPTGVTFWVVQPVDAEGNELDLDAEGELTPDALLLAQPVDFGRLNIVRSPQSVLDQALGEALKVINNGEAFSLDFCGRLTIWNTDMVAGSPTEGELIITKTIDSPRESMAMYQEIMNNGFSDQLAALEGSGIDPIILAASCFAAGSDKTGTVNIDEVVYINGFIDCLGCNPILNEYEHDFSNDNKWYFNFGDCDCDMEGEQQFQYNRDVYKDRMLSITTLNEDGTWSKEEVSVWQAIEDRGLFTYRWADYDHTHVQGFTLAVDDAVQVLDFVHGDSNVEFLPEVPVVP